ncbi:MAG: efflux RND transporter periplasmic adaptor subunit [Planctomycetota bacterium]
MRRKDRIAALVLGLALAAGFVLSQRPHPRRPSRPAAEAAGERKVSTAKAEAREIQVFAESVGTVRSRRQTQIASRVLAEVKEIRKQPGDAVAAKEVLILLDSLDLRARAEQAEATLRSMEELLKEAQAEFDRVENLLNAGARTRQEYDAARFGLEATRARREAAEKALLEARIQLGYATIVAPFDGIVYEKHADPGDLAVPGKPLLGLYDPGALRLEALVEESLLWRISLKDKLRVKIDALEGTVVGEVSEAVPAVDPVTRTGTVKIDLPQGLGLRPGMFGRARIPIARRSAVVVPEAAIVRRGQLEIAFVLGPDPDAARRRARWKLVRIGPPLEPEALEPEGIVEGRLVEVLSGLAPGDEVAVSGAADLREGDLVEVAPGGAAERPGEGR